MRLWRGRSLDPRQALQRRTTSGSGIAFPGRPRRAIRPGRVSPGGLEPPTQPRKLRESGLSSAFRPRRASRATSESCFPMRIAQIDPRLLAGGLRSAAVRLRSSNGMSVWCVWMACGLAAACADSRQTYGDPTPSRAGGPRSSDGGHAGLREAPPASERRPDRLRAAGPARSTHPATHAHSVRASQSAPRRSTAWTRSVATSTTRMSRRSSARRRRASPCRTGRRRPASRRPSRPPRARAPR